MSDQPEVARSFKCVHCTGRGEVVRMNPAWLRWKRESAGMSLRAMARYLGVSAPYVSDVERGRRSIPDSWRAQYVRACQTRGSEVAVTRRATGAPDTPRAPRPEEP